MAPGTEELVEVGGSAGGYEWVIHPTNDEDEDEGGGAGTFHDGCAVAEFGGSFGGALSRRQQPVASNFGLLSVAGFQQRIA
jgi:hypothetical protein